MLRAIALALRVLMLRAIALALRVLMLRAIALALRVLMLRAIALALRVLMLRAIALARAIAIILNRDQRRTSKTRRDGARLTPDPTGPTDPRVERDARGTMPRGGQQQEVQRR